MRVLSVAELDFPLLASRTDWECGEVPPVIRKCQDEIAQAAHLVIFYPLWLGSMPALLKGFLEQVMRPGFAISTSKSGKSWKKLLAGKSARVVVTMGMPALMYRWFFGAHSLKSLERNILGFCGVAPVRESLIGLVESMSEKRRQRWLEEMESLGRRGR